MISKYLDQSYKIENLYIVDEKMACIRVKIPSIVDTERVTVYKQKEKLKK